MRISSETEPVSAHSTSPILYSSSFSENAPAAVRVPAPSDFTTIGTTTSRVTPFSESLPATS
jgi:hypothetical protein